ncbi:MAG: alkaline phosphatase [Ignavibacteriaceae bacterium]|nr:alkaline phosphatase [Ignavibacteriaceae bacterium]
MHKKSLIVSILLIISFQLFAETPVRPKNIIIMIGDGMGVNYVSTEVLRNPQSPFREFSNSGFSITCSADKLITDSAAGATALLSGYRTKNGSVGSDSTGVAFKSILEYSQEKNYKSGIVVTCGLTHATPAALYASVKSRKEEFDIADQLIASNVDIFIGGGRKFFLPIEINGIREDGINLLKELSKHGYSYYDDYASLKKSLSTESKVAGIIEIDALPHASKRDYSLGDLTQIAINNLQKSENGFVMLVEGSQIDWAGHDNKADYAISEMDDFAKAVKVCIDFANEDKNTLVLVTADHETGGMSIKKGSLDGSMELAFTHTSHTAEMVPVFSHGPGAELFKGILDNYEIGRRLIKLVNPEALFK